jgi:hypothetical protein
MQLWTSKFELFFVFCFYRMILCPVPVFFSEAISCTLAMFWVWACNYAQLPELLAVYNYIFVVQGVLLWILIDHNSHDTQSRTQVCYIFPGLIMFIGSCLLVLSSLLPDSCFWWHYGGISEDISECTGIYILCSKVLSIGVRIFLLCIIGSFLQVM